MRAIKVTKVETLTYVPNLKEEAYVKYNCQSVDDALRVDEADLKEGEIDLTMLSKDNFPEASYTLEIVDIDESS